MDLVSSCWTEALEYVKDYREPAYGVKRAKKQQIYNSDY